MTTVGLVREWDNEEGWGVIDSPQTPGGCWAHYNDVAVAGYKSLDPGQSVHLEWEAVEQDGFAYRAVRTCPRAIPPSSILGMRDPRRMRIAIRYRSRLTIRPQRPALRLKI